MPGGLIALLDDVAALAKLASSSIDDVAGAAARAGSKAAGVVIDDAAVTPRYVVGLPPARELPIIGKIALGSLRNKLLFILPASLALSAFAPWAITPVLMIGGTYLCFEAAEKIWGALTGSTHASEVVEITDAAELEKRQVSGAIHTDFILSAEIMAIALAELPDLSFAVQAAALALVAIIITGVVYGIVAIIVKIDDVGRHLALQNHSAVQTIGRGLVAGTPGMLKLLSHFGVAAMLWVGGGIILHGLEAFGLGAVPHALHHWAENISSAAPAGQSMVRYLLNALLASVTGLLVGILVVVAEHGVRRLRSGASAR